RLGWWLLAALLGALGLNKELDLQTLLFDLGRRMAKSEGWYDERRAVQAVFTLALAIGMGGALWAARSYFREFASQNPAAIAGLGFLCVFVLFRACSADHLWRVGDEEYDDKSWSWVLEVAGLALLIRAAVGSIRRP